VADQVCVGETETDCSDCNSELCKNTVCFNYNQSLPISTKCFDPIEEIDVGNKTRFSAAKHADSLAKCNPDLCCCPVGDVFLFMPPNSGFMYFRSLVEGTKCAGRREISTMVDLSSQGLTFATIEDWISNGPTLFVHEGSIVSFMSLGSGQCTFQAHRMDAGTPFGTVVGIVLGSTLAMILIVGVSVFIAARRRQARDYQVIQ
jgi:hypothetical protein